MAKRDLYDILGISKTASADEIKAAHRKLVRKYHPDVNKSDKSAETKFKEAQEAYDVLSDPEKRKNYDQFGHAGVNGGPGGGGDPFAEAFRRSQAGGRTGATVEGFDPSQFSNAADFSDIFDQLFGGRGGVGGMGGGVGGQTRARGRRNADAPSPARGADIEHGVTINFEHAARGVTVPLQITRDGKLETIDVKIPAGVKEGSKIRLKGKGQHVVGGEAGDLYIMTTVRPHDQFRREDLDVLLDVPVTIYEALLGTKATVPTLDGEVTITIPAGTSSGAKLRVKGRGVFRGDDKGDQLCVVKIIVPKHLNDEAKELVKQLETAAPVSAR